MYPNVLIVEDESIIALDVKEQFISRGFGVVATSKAADALSLARNHNVKVALIDVNLGGGFDGLDVARAVSKEGDCQVILMTAYSQLDLEGRLDGIDDIQIVYKPAETADVIRAVTDALKRQHANAQT